MGDFFFLLLNLSNSRGLFFNRVDFDPFIFYAFFTGFVGVDNRKIRVQ